MNYIVSYKLDISSGKTEFREIKLCPKTTWWINFKAYD